MVGGFLSPLNPICKPTPPVSLTTFQLLSGCVRLGAAASDSANLRGFPAKENCVQQCV